MQKSATRFVRRWTVRSRALSARQRDLSILWKVSMRQRRAYQSSFSMPSALLTTDRSVSSFQSIRGPSFGL